jgi:hypothetical protein
VRRISGAKPGIYFLRVWYVVAHEGMLRINVLSGPE